MQPPLPTESAFLRSKFGKSGMLSLLRDGRRSQRQAAVYRHRTALRRDLFGARRESAATLRRRCKGSKKAPDSSAKISNRGPKPSINARRSWRRRGVH